MKGLFFPFRSLFFIMYFPMRFLPFLALALSAFPVFAQKVTLTPDDKGLRVEIDGKLFTEYVTKDVPRPFLYPIIGAGGENVVRNFPMIADLPGEPQDHKHHRGLWFAHGLVNGQDFWSEDKEFGKQEASNIVAKAEGNKGTFTTDTKWVSADGKVQMTDSRKITITALPNDEKFIDFDITLKASEGEVILGDTKEGTMAIRLCPQLSFPAKTKQKEPVTGKAFNSNGETQMDIWAKRADWVCYYGPDPKGNEVGVAILSHPSNFRSPTTWHARDYGLFAVNPFGLHDFEGLKKGDQDHKGDHKLAKGESLNFRYRFYFAKGQPSAEALTAKFKTYSAE